MLEIANESADIRAKIMEEEGITEVDVWDDDEISDIPKILPAEVTDQVPGMERAIICGDPIKLGDRLDFQQGFDNPYGAFGTCGLTSISNICTIAGMEVSEPDVVEYAMENNLCEQGSSSAFGGGGTTIKNQIEILEHYGIEAHCEFAETATPQRLAEAIEGGHGVILGLNSGILQNREWKIYNDNGEIAASHAVCLTGTVRSAETGELIGFYMCDSSGQTPDAGRTFVTLEKLEECYGEVRGGFATITNNPIR